MKNRTISPVHRDTSGGGPLIWSWLFLYNAKKRLFPSASLSGQIRLGKSRHLHNINPSQLLELVFWVGPEPAILLLRILARMQTLHVAFDDTDPRAGRFKTHLAFRVAEQLKKAGAKLVDYPL